MGSVNIWIFSSIGMAITTAARPTLLSSDVATIMNCRMCLSLIWSGVKVAVSSNVIDVASFVILKSALSPV